ncbi:10813_t:CDS:1, partial [Ambispora gerdemannii]
LVKNDKFKILPAHQFHYVKEAERSEAGAYLAFPDLLSEINDSSKELVFIPVNNPDFH